MSSAPIPAPPQDASATVRGLVSTGAQTFAGAKTFTGTVTAPNITTLASDLDAAESAIVTLQASSHAAVTLGAVGSTPNANGASLAGQVLTLQPADASSPGVVTTAAQTFAGVKTFSNKIVISAQAGHAIELGTSDWISWPGGPARLGQLQGYLYADQGGFRTNSALGYIMGGVNSQFASGGMYALAQSYSADIYQAQAANKLTILCAKGASAGVVVKIGTLVAAPHADAEILRIGKGMGVSSVSDGTAQHKFMGDGRLISSTPASAPTDANLLNGSISFYLDESGHNLMVRVKYADGTTLKTGTLAIS